MQFRQVLVFLGIFIFMILNSAYADSKFKNVREGNKMFKQGDYASSAKEYEEALQKDPESDIVHFNLGTALYKKEDYDQALEHLQQALLSDQASIRQKAHYNLGNTFYQSGLKYEQGHLENAISFLEKSVVEYQRALELNPKDSDAKDNVDFVKKELERLKKKLKEQKSQQQSAEQNKKQDQQRQSSSQENQQQKQTQEKEPQGNKSEPQKENQSQQADQKETQSQEQEQKKQDSEQQASIDKKKDSKGQNQQQTGQQQENQKGEKKGTAKTPEELTSKEAQMLLKDYRQTEEPKGLLKFYRGSGKNEPVLKDW